MFVLSGRCPTAEACKHEPCWIDVGSPSRGSWVDVARKLALSDVLVQCFLDLLLGDVTYDLFFYLAALEYQ